MKNKDFDTVETIRRIREKNYEETKDLSRKELLEWYKKRGKTAKDQFSKNFKNSKGEGVRSI